MPKAGAEGVAEIPLGTGEVDFAGYGEALRGIGFSGPCVYELADGDDTRPRFRDARELVRPWGWEI